MSNTVFLNSWQTSLLADHAEAQKFLEKKIMVIDDTMHPILAQTKSKLLAAETWLMFSEESEGHLGYELQFNWSPRKEYSDDEQIQVVYRGEVTQEIPYMS